MHAKAHLVTELRAAAGSVARTAVATLHSEAPLVLRMARAKEPEPWVRGVQDVARVALMAGAAGPVGGDELSLTVEVGPGSSLVLSEISPTLLLPGPHGEQSRTTVRIRVGAGGTLIWVPEPMVAADGCDHVHVVAVQLGQGATFLMREELLLGRHGESGGRVTQRVSIHLQGVPLYRQDLRVGYPEARTPPVLGTHRAIGSTLIVDPAWAESPPRAHRLDGEAGVLPLAGPAALITALADDNLQLRDHLTAGLSALGDPWEPQRTTTMPSPSKGRHLS
ncbi:MAG: urease accessory protein UreD [Knoellia sp.]